MIAANYLYNKAAQDGTAIGSLSRNIPHYAFARKPNVQFDPLKFNWIGSPEMTHRGCFATAASGADELIDERCSQLVQAGSLDALVAALRWFDDHRAALPGLRRGARLQAERSTWEQYRSAVTDAVAPFV